ncbi:hypothetical protein C2E20_1169 [Micractinium conductrix]|uniref:Uncharacterized protein n=1 Tax=Micractinium conductrix TaxID=554055 RepID=A0A2P6VNT2_9CHLO|nr:hypothetical protein C2E20_1169 [Micractinium conductrix]|eukprot:PSC75763.1 hypothetical protein C2E20_1169 [Micractinium conductrix]
MSRRATTASGPCSAAVRSRLRAEQTVRCNRRQLRARRLQAATPAAWPPQAAAAAAAAAASSSAAASGAASAAAPPATAAALHAAAAVAPLASVVPEFPRFIDQPVRDWIGAAVENLQGFNADDAARLLLPDLVGLAGRLDGPTLLIGGILVLAFIYWEGGILLQELRERQRRQSERQRRQRRSSSIFDSWGGEDEGGADGVDGWDGGAGDEALQAEQQEQRRQQRQTRLDRASNTYLLRPVRSTSLAPGGGQLGLHVEGIGGTVMTSSVSHKHALLCRQWEKTGRKELAELASWGGLLPHGSAPAPALTLGSVAGTTHRLEVAALWQEHVAHLEGQGRHSLPQEQLESRLLARAASGLTGAAAVAGLPAFCR